VNVDDCGHETVFLHRFGIGAATYRRGCRKAIGRSDPWNRVAGAIVLVTSRFGVGKGCAMTDVSQANDGETRQSGTSDSGGETTADKFKSQFASFKSQASDKARDYAGQGVTRATGALDEAAKFLEDTARSVEEKMGPQYGRYGFSAAESVSGFADQLRGKDLEELTEDMRSFVRKSPAIAIGAAVGLGFVLARLVKAGAGYEANEGSQGGKPASSATGGDTAPASPTTPA
jgi:hypothetical protein